jgi:hypothetical protein
MLLQVCCVGVLLHDEQLIGSFGSNGEVDLRLGLVRLDMLRESPECFYDLISSPRLLGTGHVW